MTSIRSVAASASVALIAAALPLFAHASPYGYTYSVGYGPGTSMCPSPYNNYYSCASGLGGIFGAGGLVNFNGSTAPYYSGYGGYGGYGGGYYYQPSTAYQYQQPAYYGQTSYNYMPTSAYYYAPTSYSYGSGYGYSPSYSYGYMPSSYQYASAGAPAYYYQY